MSALRIKPRERPKGRGVKPAEHLCVFCAVGKSSTNTMLIVGYPVGPVCTTHAKEMKQVWDHALNGWPDEKNVREGSQRGEGMGSRVPGVQGTVGVA